MPPLTQLAKGDRPYEGLRSLDLLRGVWGAGPPGRRRPQGVGPSRSNRYHMTLYSQTRTLGERERELTHPTVDGGKFEDSKW
jgi:hypothetical protein